MTKSTEACQELATFLKRSSLLKVLEEQILWGVSRLMEEKSYGANQKVFSEGDESDALYIIRSGQVAVLKGKGNPRPVAYLTAGDCFGEIGVVQGTKRSASILVPEAAVVLKLSKKAFDELRRKFPQITSELAGIINSRLTGEIDFQPAGLTGNFSVFDMATVLQTITSSKQSGTMILSRRGGDEVGVLVFDKGRLRSAHCDRLRGATAVYDLLQKNEPHDFRFNPRADVSQMDPDEALLGRPLEMILLEGMRRADEVPVLKQKLGKIGDKFVRTDKVPENREMGEASSEVFDQVWALLIAPSELTKLTTYCTADHYTILKLLEALHEGSYIEKAKDPEPEGSDTGRLRLTQKEIQIPRGIELIDLPESESDDGSQTMTFSAHVSTTTKLIYALNSAASSLSIILDKKTVRTCLSGALTLAQEQFPQLAGLAIDEDDETLDIRGLQEGFTKADNTEALKTLTRAFLELVVYADWFGQEEKKSD